MTPRDNMVDAPFLSGVGSVDEDAEGARGEDDVGFADFESPENREGDQGDGYGRPVGDGLAGQHHDGAGQGAGSGCGGPGYERLDLGVVAVAEEPAARHDHAEVDR